MKKIISGSAFLWGKEDPFYFMAYLRCVMEKSSALRVSTGL